tara:strand:+ start:93412 stop:93894 length:483 start_codon:yes stop_codon:yes gene_type:complete
MIDLDNVIIDFLRTGKLGRLELGMSRSQVIEAIEFPDDEGYHRGTDPQNNCVLLYGELDKVNLQLAIHQGKLTGIWLYFNGSDNLSSLPNWMTLKSWPLKGTSSINHFFAIAAQSGLAWRLNHSLTNEDQTTLLVSLTNLKLIWNFDPNSLYAIMLPGQR